MKRIFNVLYTCWVNCMCLWLGIWCFCAKIAIFTCLSQWMLA